ncbi:MAG: serine/threonine protein kinase, partial [Pyrinomonadaceae bacterium]|nr:serine/threonine protein kinase [Pyrinomonadaceae bacterium]
MKECQTCKSCYSDSVNHCPKDGMPTFHSISGEPLLEDKYQLISRIGQGGMGVVYKATHRYLKTLHAVKVILPDLVGNDPQLVTRFRQEALAAAAIRHHNVVAVTDYGVVQGTMPFLVMEYVEGESLHDLLSREKRLSPEKAFEIMSAICAGVGAAHRQGIVHRDLKPLNVMILKGRPMAEAVKILDFGLAKIKSGELLGSFIQAQTTGLMGSPYYMAPEQWADEEPDARSDVYSLGILLYQMLAGDVPFKGSSIPAIMKKHLTDEPPRFAELNIPITQEIENAVRHTLAKDRFARTQTVEQMTEELRNAIGLSFHSVSLGSQQPENNILTTQGENTQNQNSGSVSQPINTIGVMPQQTPQNLASQTQNGVQQTQVGFQNNEQTYISQ